MMRSLVNTWGLVERRGNGETPATRCPPRAFATSPTGTAPSCRPRRASGARPSPPTNRAADGTWDTASRRGRRQTKHADGITWFLSKLAAETQGRPRQRAGVVRPHRQVRPGLQLGGYPPSPPTPWGRLVAGAFTYRSTSSTSFAPATPGESLPACVPTRATTGRPSIRKTSRRSPPRCSSWTPRR